MNEKDKLWQLRHHKNTWENGVCGEGKKQSADLKEKTSQSTPPRGDGWDHHSAMVRLWNSATN